MENILETIALTENVLPAMFPFVLGAEENILGLKIVLKIPIISLIEAKR
jgi:hypothetical protein